MSVENTLFMVYDKNSSRRKVDSPEVLNNINGYWGGWGESANEGTSEITGRRIKGFVENLYASWRPIPPRFCITNYVHLIRNKAFDT